MILFLKKHCIFQEAQESEEGSMLVHLVKRWNSGFTLSLQAV